MLISCTEKQVLNCFSFFPPALTEVLANFALLTVNWLIVLDCLKCFFFCLRFVAMFSFSVSFDRPLKFGGLCLGQFLLHKVLINYLLAAQS